jgi:hemimethylated DNA binding protein
MVRGHSREVRPRKDQPFYHLLAENDETEYVAYVSEQNLLEDSSGQPLRHPQLGEFFERTRRRLRATALRHPLNRNLPADGLRPGGRTLSD